MIKDVPTFTAVVSLQGETGLVVDICGQLQYLLVLYRGTEFRLEGLTGYSLRFLPDERGAVDHLLIIRPDGIYKARRQE